LEKGLCPAYTPNTVFDDTSAVQDDPDTRIRPAWEGVR